MEPNCFSFSIPALLASVDAVTPPAFSHVPNRSVLPCSNLLTDHVRVNHLRDSVRWHAMIRRSNRVTVRAIRDTRRHRYTRPKAGCSRSVAASRAEAATCWHEAIRRLSKKVRRSHGSSRTAVS
jgi:hypothetical protein